jgi:hypothetical protein
MEVVSTKPHGCINELFSFSRYTGVMDQATTQCPGAGDRGFRVIVPTRDSAPWIGAIAQAYGCLGVRPLFVLDSRSIDGTFAVLRGIGADAVEILPAENCVEDIIWRLQSLTGADWTLRFDDDEMPSAALLHWVRANLHTLTLPVVAFARRWAIRAPDGLLSFAERKHLYYIQGRPDLLDPQFRLYRPDKVQYCRRIHTPGFALDDAIHIAPPEAFICHFDWVLRSFDERHAKLILYDAELPGCGGSLSYFYLPEPIPPADRRETPANSIHLQLFSQGIARARGGVAVAA